METKDIQAVLPNIVVTGGCITVLALVLGPVFLQRHAPARQISCLSNLKMLGTGTLMYVQDYDGRLPRAANWMDATYPYSKNTEIYRCPKLKEDHLTGFGYAFNATLTLQNWEKYKTPATTVMQYDANDLRWNANAPGRTGIANPPRHGGMDNFGFMDGHAKSQQLLDTGE